MNEEVKLKDFTIFILLLRATFTQDVMQCLDHRIIKMNFFFYLVKKKIVKMLLNMSVIGI